jgi:hypothetical protein
MSKTVNLTPSMRVLPAEVEMQMNTPALGMGQNVGGVQMYSSSFKRGYGENVFGVDENGQWLGGADFDTAPLRFYMNGSMFAQGENGQIQIDTVNNRIIVYDENDVPVILIGKQVGGF